MINNNNTDEETKNREETDRLRAIVAIQVMNHNEKEKDNYLEKKYTNSEYCVAFIFAGLMTHPDGPNRYERVKNYTSNPSFEGCKCTGCFLLSGTEGGVGISTTPEVRFIFTNPMKSHYRTVIERTCDGMIKYTNYTTLGLNLLPGTSHKQYFLALLNALRLAWKNRGLNMPKNDLIIVPLCSDLLWHDLPFAKYKIEDL